MSASGSCRANKSLYIVSLWTLQVYNLLSQNLCGVLTALQTQCLIQIIANRVGLIMVDKRKARTLKWTLFSLVGLINISVFVIWIPTRMNISHTFAHVNNIWDRIEKVLYLIIDGALNGYFLYLVRAKLISRGLNKYKPLFNFNAVIVGVSLSMDVSHGIQICAQLLAH